MLTLPEELLLLSLDEHGHTPGVPPGHLEAGLLAAAVFELHLRGRASIEPEAVLLTGEDGLTEDAALHAAAEQIRKAEQPRSLEEHIEAAAAKSLCLRDKVRDALVAKGVVRHDEGRILWLVPQHRYAVEHGAEEVSLLDRLARALILQKTVDRRTGALLALLASCFTTDAQLRERLFAGMRDRMYEIVNSGGAAQGTVRDSVCAALAATAAPLLHSQYSGLP